MHFLLVDGVNVCLTNCLLIFVQDLSDPGPPPNQPHVEEDAQLAEAVSLSLKVCCAVLVKIVFSYNNLFIVFNVNKFRQQSKRRHCMTRVGPEHQNPKLLNQLTCNLGTWKSQMGGTSQGHWLSIMLSVFLFYDYKPVTLFFLFIILWSTY